MLYNALFLFTILKLIQFPFIFHSPAIVRHAGRIINLTTFLEFSNFHVLRFTSVTSSFFLTVTASFASPP